MSVLIIRSAPAAVTPVSDESAINSTVVGTTPVELSPAAARGKFEVVNPSNTKYLYLGPDDTLTNLTATVVIPPNGVYNAVAAGGLPSQDAFWAVYEEGAPPTDVAWWEGEIVPSDAPFAMGKQAGNHTIKANQYSATRFICPKTGTIAKVHFQHKYATGYGAGTYGIEDAKLCAVNPDGTPDLDTVLASDQWSPPDRAPDGAVTKDGGTWMVANVAVTAGQELVLVVGNADPDPTTNYFSTNFLYLTEGATLPFPGIEGAQARNERDGDAVDAFYGLDPRSVVMGSHDSGATWQIPGNTSNINQHYLPTYLLEYADDTWYGQPFATGRLEGPASTGLPNGMDLSQVMRVPVGSAHTFDYIGAFCWPRDDGTPTKTLPGKVEIYVDEVLTRTEWIAGKGQVRKRIAPLVVPGGSIVRIHVTTGSTVDRLPIKYNYTWASWTAYLGLGDTYRWGGKYNTAHGLEFDAATDGGTFTPTFHGGTPFGGNNQVCPAVAFDPDMAALAPVLQASLESCVGIEPGDMIVEPSTLVSRKLYIHYKGRLLYESVQGLVFDGSNLTGSTTLTEGKNEDTTQAHKKCPGIFLGPHPWPGDLKAVV